MRGSRLLLIAAALALGGLLGPPIFAAFVVAYGVVWAIANYALDDDARPPSTIFGQGLLVVVVLAVVAVNGAALWQTEQLEGLDVVLADRARWARTPAIAPPVILTDRPQRLYGHAPGAARFRVLFDDDAVEARALEGGLFVLDVDPRKTAIGAAPRVEIDGESSPAPLIVATPLAHPRWPCTDGRRVFVPSEETDELWSLDGATWRSRATLDGPTSCVVLDDGRVVVGHRHDPHLLVDGSTLAVGAGQRRLATNGARIAVATVDPPAIIEVDERGAPVRHAVEHAPDWLVYAGGTIVYSSREHHTLERLDGRAPIFFGRPAVTLTRSPSGRRVFVALTDYRPDGDAGPNHHVAEQIVVVDVAEWRIVDRFETGDLGATPTGIWARDEATLDVAFAGSDSLARVVVTGSERGVVRRDALRSIFTPHGLVAVGDALVVASPVSGAIAVLDAQGESRFAVPSAERASEVREGERAFYEATRSGVSCATCHLHGGSDFALHDIGHATPRPTLDVRGIWGTAPYLRGASYPRVGALHGFAATVLGGYAREEPRRPELLEAFVRQLVRPAPPRARPTRAGSRAFLAAGCAECHTFPAFTNLSQVPAAALFPARADERHLLDTPSLIGVAASAPYLFDGRKRSLRDVVLDDDASGRHGRAASLDEEARSALLAFLEAL